MLQDFLRQVPLFQDLEAAQLDRMADLAREESLPSHHVLFREGDAVDAFYLVRSGCVTVFRDAKGKPLQLLARLGEWGFFGEMGLLNKARRLATARTLGPTTVLRIDKTDLLAVLDERQTASTELLDKEIALRLTFARALMATRGFTPEVVDAYGRTLELCESAVATEFYNPDLFHNLARVHLRMGRRDRAYPVLLRGLQLHPGHRGILGDLRGLGIRRRPLLPFLSRGNPVNRFLGALFRDTPQGAAEDTHPDWSGRAIAMR